jgi:hypothetical protein
MIATLKAVILEIVEVWSSNQQVRQTVKNAGTIRWPQSEALYLDFRV